MDPGSKVTYNGVEIGRVAHIAETEVDDGGVAGWVGDGSGVEGHL
nr:hypothetical protein [Mycobacterium palustre]